MNNKNKPIKKAKIERPKLQRPCEYQLPNCLKTTDLQYIKQLGGVNISKSWICDNCLKLVKYYEKNK